MVRPDSKRLASLSPLWVICLVALGAGYRIAVPVFELPWNSAPLMALTFGGSLFLGARIWYLPALIMLISDLVLGWLYPGDGLAAYTLTSALFYLFTARVGAWAGERRSPWPTLWLGTLLSGVGFYLWSNTITWIVLPEYAKTLAGWWQCQTIGLPQFTPAWVFLRNSLIADTLWCLLAGVIYVAFRRPRPLGEGELALP